MKRLMIITFAVLLSGCETLENYEFGDLTRGALTAAQKLVQLKRDYCSVENKEAREYILAAIRAIEPDYQGKCHED